jgi:hypothetical protein
VSHVRKRWRRAFQTFSSFEQLHNGAIYLVPCLNPSTSYTPLSEFSCTVQDKEYTTIYSYWDWVLQQSQEIASRIFFSYSRHRQEIIAPRAHVFEMAGPANTATAIT